jgi:hypothetical protein
MWLTPPSMAYISSRARLRVRGYVSERLAYPACQRASEFSSYGPSLCFFRPPGDKAPGLPTCSLGSGTLSAFNASALAQYGQSRNRPTRGAVDPGRCLFPRGSLSCRRSPNPRTARWRRS